MVDSAVVIDASVAAAWCFHDEATEASRTLLRSLPDRQVVVPLLWHAKCASLLLTGERRKRVCAELLELLGGLPIETDNETARIPGPVLRLAPTRGLTVYDAIYADLASRRGMALATRDKHVRQAASAMRVAVIEM